MTEHWWALCCHCYHMHKDLFSSWQSFCVLVTHSDGECHIGHKRCNKVCVSNNQAVLLEAILVSGSWYMCSLGQRGEAVIFCYFHGSQAVPISRDPKTTHFHSNCFILACRTFNDYHPTQNSQHVPCCTELKGRQTPSYFFYITEQFPTLENGSLGIQEHVATAI